MAVDTDGGYHVHVATEDKIMTYDMKMYLTNF